ncbi:L-ribulose-5-phosphate 3-epimerase UlaE [Bradyrhizobium sp. USDA 4454]
MIIVNMMAARLAPRWLPAKVQFHLPKRCLSMHAQHNCGHADPAIVEEAGEVVPARSP